MRSDEDVRMAHAWPDTGEFSVQAQAKDEEGLTSMWSRSYVVTITLLKWRYYIGNIVNSNNGPGIAIQNSLHHASSITDSKTGLYNHQFFMKRLEQELGHIRRHRTVRMPTGCGRPSFRPSGNRPSASRTGQA